MKNPKLLNLGDVLYKWRAMSKLGLRGAAEELKLSASSISRIENGEMTPDSESFMRILNWLMSPAKEKR